MKEHSPRLKFWNINFSLRVFKGMIYYLHTCTTCITQDAHRCMAYGPVTPLSFIISHCYHYQQLSRRGPFLSFICAVRDQYAGWAVKWLPELSACVNWFNWRKFQVDLLLSFKWEATHMNLFAHPVGAEQCSQSFLESGFQSLFTPPFTSDLVFRPNHWRKCDSLADKCSSMFTSCLVNQIIASRHCWVKTDLFGCPGRRSCFASSYVQRSDVSCFSLPLSCACTSWILWSLLKRFNELHCVATSASVFFSPSPAKSSLKALLHQCLSSGLSGDHNACPVGHICSFAYQWALCIWYAGGFGKRRARRAGACEGSFPYRSATCSIGSDRPRNEMLSGVIQRRVEREQKTRSTGERVTTCDLCYRRSGSRLSFTF